MDLGFTPGMGLTHLLEHVPSMKRNRRTPEQIIRELREADADLANGMALPEVCKKPGVAANIDYRWRDLTMGSTPISECRDSVTRSRRRCAGRA
jgi:hypothetical protein